jgi:hypothetical protein
MKTRYWAVVMDDDLTPYGGLIGYTWDKKHPEDKRKRETVQVYAIYPNKKDALDDVKFRGFSKVKEVRVKVRK